MALNSLEFTLREVREGWELQGCRDGRYGPKDVEALVSYDSELGTWDFAEGRAVSRGR